MEMRTERKIFTINGKIIKIDEDEESGCSVIPDFVYGGKDISWYPGVFVCLLSFFFQCFAFSSLPWNKHLNWILIAF